MMNSDSVDPVQEICECLLLVSTCRFLASQGLYLWIRQQFASYHARKGSHFGSSCHPSLPVLCAGVGKQCQKEKFTMGSEIYTVHLCCGIMWYLGLCSVSETPLIHMIDQHARYKAVRRAGLSSSDNFAKCFLGDKPSINWIFSLMFWIAKQFFCRFFCIQIQLSFLHDELITFGLIFCIM